MSKGVFMKQRTKCMIHKASHTLICEVTEQEERMDDLIVHTHSTVPADMRMKNQMKYLAWHKTTSKHISLL